MRICWRKLPYALLLASLLVFGFFPRLLTEKIKPVTEQIVNMATAKTGEAIVENGLLGRPQPSSLAQEREISSPLPGKPGDGDLQHGSRLNEDGKTPPPLLGGEGRGEGEHGNNSRENQSRLTSAVAKSP